MAKIKQIKLSKLLLWGDNPRIANTAGETLTTKDIIEKLYNKNPQHFKNLANDIALKGLVPSDLPIVFFNEETNNYSVYEGNRRVAIFKSIYSPGLCSFDDSLLKLMRKLKKNINQEVTPYKMNCCIVDTMEEAITYVERLHSGEDSGRGRLNWGNLEKESFKVIKNGVTNGNIKVSPAYTLINNYDVFKDIVALISPSSVNRLLVSSDLKNSMEIKTYDNLSQLQIELLMRTLKHAKALSDEHKIPVSRLFRTVADTKSRLVPYIIEEKAKLIATEEFKNTPVIPIIPELKLKTDKITHKTTNTLNLINSVTNYGAFDSVEIAVVRVDSQKNIDISDYILPADVEEGTYKISFNGLLNGKIASTKTIELEVEPFIPKERAIKKRFNYIIDVSGHTIKISNSVDAMIIELNNLRIQDFPLTIAVSLRFLVEESLKVVHSKKGWTPTDKSLGASLTAFKNGCTNLIIKDINKITNLGEVAIKNFISVLDPYKFALELNNITHSPNSVTPTEISELGKTKVSKLLQILTGLC